MNHDAFVSYASTDRVVAYQMVDYLEACGIRCWVAPRDVPGGRNYAEAILGALVESKLFLLLFSDESNGSEHVQREVERALHLSKPIVPVRIKDVLPSGAMDYYLATLHWIDAFAPDADAGDSLSELSLEDVARAAGSLLGRDQEVREAVAEIHRQREESEQRRIEAEREARIRAEAEAKAKLEAEAKAKQEAEAEARRRQIEEEQKREREAALERQRQQEAIDAKARAEAKQREEERRKREDERAELKRREVYEKAKAEAETRAAAAAAAEAARFVTAAASPAAVPVTESDGQSAAASGASMGQRLAIALVLVVLLVGIGVWAKGYFQAPERESTDTGLLVSRPDGNPSTTNHPQPEPTDIPPVEPPSIAQLRGHFEWAGEQHAVAYAEVLRLSVAKGAAIGKTRRKGEVLEIVLPDSEEKFEADVTLAIPGFEPIHKRAAMSEGEVEVDFGPLTRLTGELSVHSEYADQPRASEAHQPHLKMLRLVWQGSDIDSRTGLAENAAASEWLDKLHMAAHGEAWECSPIAGEEASKKLPTGRYRAVLVSDCSAPFDRISLADVNIAATAESPVQIRVPIVPIGVFGGDTTWTSTTTEAGRDKDGTVAWTLYNLPASSDFADNGPRLVQSYTDIVSQGQLLKKYYLPAPITEVRFDSHLRRWHLRVDPTSIVGGLEDDDLTDRYFEKIDFYLRYHSDKRGLLFDAETVDQPLNATEGTKREFTLQNAYPDFGETIPTLATRYPGFGVLDLNKVYDYLVAYDKNNADAYKRSATTPASMQTPVPVILGIEPDLDFAGSGKVRLKKIVPGSPGDKAGLKAGDLVVSLGGMPVEEVADFYRIRFSLGVGVATEIKLVRGGLSRTLVITPIASD